MDRHEALKLLRGGEQGIRDWNLRRDAGESIPHLDGANLSSANLNDADLSNADLNDADLTVANLNRADLSGANLAVADLTVANLNRADLSGANLSCANLNRADLSDANLNHTNLSDANLAGANLARADLSVANLNGANLSIANLNRADLSGAHLKRADLSGADLQGANLYDAVLSDANLAKVYVFGTVFAFTNLGKVKGLDHVRFLGPCPIDLRTLKASRGQIPDSFLQGCGLQPWEVLNAKLYDRDMTALQIADLQAEAFRLRTEGPIFIGGVFISYAREDSDFVDKLRDKLRENGVSVWVDRHDAVAGSVDRQVVDAIRLNDIVLLVLSKSSVDSEWVEYELEKARQKEKDEKRDVLCPVTLDHAWEAKLDDVLWRQVKKKNVLDFSGWTDDAAFGPVFQKLLDGLKKYYPPKG